ncbi:hypothetical protein ACOXXX_13155 [Thalassococcus sp. BH17M4-6]|uniref:hypothetical protein n=1 Tax=Thalassococcus sp. BH17M4-6 TaxID=3413148 RepID=UPI003BDB3757
MRLIVLMICGAAMVAGCSKGPNHVAFDGVYYRAKVKAPRNDRANFVATIKPVSKGLNGARAAGAYEGVKHCIEYYGTSDIEWAVGPDTAPEALPVTNDTLTFRGTCIE